MIHWIESIPATFWAVLAGSFFTLVGVWLTNRAQAVRLERQLQHESVLKSEERELALKRDVYLPATEAISAGVAVVGRLPDLSIPQERLLDEWVARSPAIARATLVANDRTLNALSRFHASLTTKIVGLLGVRMRLTIKASECQSTMDEVNRLTSENGNLVALLQQMNVDGPTDAGRRAAITRDFEIGQKRVTELLEQHDQLNRQLFEEQLRFTRLCNQAVAELSELVVPLIASVRAELALPLDAEAYARIIKEAQSSAAVDLEAFFEELRSIVKDA